ncbi:VQ motif-containing protein [Corchorus olitorius]|uniref:VQ motif-containing protein n=1 Tax=Corchorus olitorius TaxID=93759 RepID=A0A1R3ISH3_9ROSI|nr:VQ motif-containing protein [Corchorus olitorius]
MGKKVITHPASAKPSNKNHHEKQLHSLIKVLKPKVYITNSSSFKKLVQELTGFQTTTQTSCDHNPKPEQVRESKIPVIELDDQLEGDDQIMPAAAAAAATILSTDSSFSSLELCDNYMFDDQAFHQLEEINQIPTTDEMMSRFEDDHHVYYPLSTNYQQRNWLEYQNLESWLLDTADQPFPYNYCYNNNGFSSTQNNVEQQDHQLSVFDYELSGLI